MDGEVNRIAERAERRGTQVARPAEISLGTFRDRIGCRKVDPPAKKLPVVVPPGKAIQRGTAASAPVLGECGEGGKRAPEGDGLGRETDHDEGIVHRET